MDILDSSEKIIHVFTDGSLVRKDGNIYCGYGIYFPNGEYKSISRKFTHEPITNNRAELYAILKTIIIANIINLNRLKENKTPIQKVNIYSDSEYSVKTFNEWLPKWLKSGKKYLNPDIIDEIQDHLSNADFKVKLIHVRAHTGKNDPVSKANNVVDELAKKGAFRKK
jgi:ribonuclease HI